MSVCVSRTAPISIGHCLGSSSRDSTYIDWLSPCHISFCLWDRTYIDRPSPCHASLCFSALTYIDRSSSYLFEFSLSQGRTYIDRPFPCHINLCFGVALIWIDHCLVSYSSGSHLYQSTIFVSCQFVFLGPHLYRSAISSSYQFVFRDNTYIDRSLSCQLEFGAAPIFIGHLLVISVCVSKTAPISIGHHLICSSSV